MRKFSAWFLLLLATFQWAGSLLSFRVVNLVSQKIEMNTNEQRMAFHLNQATGVDLQLRELSEDFDFSRIGYSNSFIVKDEVSTGANYIVGLDSTELLEIERTIGLSNDQQKEGQVVAFLQCVLTEYVLTADQIQDPNWVLLDGKLAAKNTSSIYSYFEALDTPPPQEVLS